MSIVLSITYDNAIVIGADRASMILADINDPSSKKKKGVEQLSYNNRKLFAYSDKIAMGFVGYGGVTAWKSTTICGKQYPCLEAILWEDFIKGLKEKYPNLSIYGIPSAFLTYCEELDITEQHRASKMMVAGYDDYGNRFRSIVDLRNNEIKCLSGASPISIGISDIADSMLKVVDKERVELSTITDAVELVDECIQTTARMAKFRCDMGVGGKSDIYVICKDGESGWARYNDVFLSPEPEPEPPKVARKVSQVSKKVAKKPTTKKTR